VLDFLIFSEERYSVSKPTAPHLLADGNIKDGTFKAKPSWNNSDKNPRIKRKEEYLKNGVEGDKTGTIYCISVGKFIPDNDHGDAAARPMRMRPTIYSWWPDRSVTARKNIRTGPIIQFYTRDNARTLVFLNTWPVADTSS